MQLTELISTKKLLGISREIEDIRAIPTDLLGLKRTAIRNAEDGDVMARVSGRTMAADIVADDAKATIKSKPAVRLTEAHIPNIKGGRALNQSEVGLLMRIVNQGGAPSDLDSVRGYIVDLVDDAIRGVQVRTNQIIVGMWIDSFSYDANGYKVSNLSWGMPSDLKVTPANLWTDATNGKPITDVMALIELGRTKYGRVYDRVTMSTTALNNMVATTQFQAQAQTFTSLAFPAGGFPVAMATRIELAGRILGVDVEIYDDTFDNENNDGTVTSTRFLPVNKVVLSSKADDNNPRVMDFANAFVTESIIGAIKPQNSGIVGGFDSPVRGPVPYAEVTMNPPQAEIWAVRRGFARKHVETATAVLTVA